MKHRLNYLDGFRGLAVLMVITYHFFGFDKFSYKGYYAFGEHIQFFSQGFYGVHLFFSISGFVILMSLEKCNNISEFTIKRIVRLWPMMLICSGVTYFFIVSFASITKTSVYNFIPSLTFIEPYIINTVLGLDSNWMDGSYWSLFIEVKFYGLAALFFFYTKNFKRTFLLFCVLISGLAKFTESEVLKVFLHMFTISDWVSWFLLGISFYLKHKGEKQWFVIYASVSLCILLFLDINVLTDELVVWFLVFMMFYFVPKMAVLSSLFSNKYLTSVGVVSYSMYLIHEYVGLELSLIINNKLDLVNPLLIYGFMILLIYIFSRVMYEAIELKSIHKVSNFYKK